MKEHAKEYLKYGYNCIPVNSDKTPACDWKHYQKNKISELGLFTSNAIAVVCGKVSDNLEVLDFDNHNNTAKNNLKKYIENSLVKSIYEKYKLPIIQTQSGGYHIYYRSDKIEGNQKLAMVSLNGKPDAIIETRGEGGYVLAPPSKGYKLIRNEFKDLQFITESERTILIEVAKSFNEHNKSVKKYKPNVDNESPGNIYDSLPESIFEAKQALESIGWLELGFNNAWRRPGKNKGISATFGNVANNVFYCFSNNVEYFEPETGYTPFQIVGLIKYNSDFSKFAGELSKKMGLNNKKDDTKQEEKKDDLRKVLSDCFNDPDIEIKQPPSVISIRNKNSVSPIMTLGNISVIKGAAKSKKSFFLSILASSAVINAEIFFNILPDLPENKRQVVLFDTEQSKFHSARMSRRIRDMVQSTSDHFGSFSFRGKSAKEIIALISYACEIYKNMGVMFIDQVADLMKSVNDESEAIEVVRFLEKLSDEKQIHISTVVHQNKLNNFAQGWLGTQLMKKAETIIEVEKDPEYMNISKVSAHLTRDIGFEDFQFMINEQGYPEIIKPSYF
jgi:hypothetical protein